MNKTIWMYWENRNDLKKPEYLNICLETIKRHSKDYKVIVLNEKTVFDYLPNIRKDINDFHELAHKADYIRAHIVYEYGGIWLDSDIILLKEIDVKERLKKNDFVGCGIEYGKPSIWFFAANKHCSILKQWIDEMDRTIDNKNNLSHFDRINVSLYNLLRGSDTTLLRPLRRKITKRVKKITMFSWTDLGYKILWELFKDYNYYHIDFLQFAPIIWNEWEKFFHDDININEIINDDSIAVMLYNKMMYNNLKNKTKDEILSSNNLLSKLFNYSLNS